MAKRATATVGQVLRTAVTAAGAAVSDRELLRRFADGNDQAAFAALVQRHTGMVLGVCRRALANPQDAEDACQATFLVLARKAKSGRWQQSVANWLYTTARRVAHNARVAAQRRAKREGRAAVPVAVEPVDRITGRELLVALDEELDKLPPRYREPLVLCYLEGLTRDEAARRLGVPAATLKAQLERGRKRLGDALTGRGCALGAGLLALAATSPAGASPPRLVQAVLAATTGSPPTAVAALAKGVAVNGVLNKSVVAVLALAGAAALALGMGAIAPSPAGQPPEKAMPAPPAQAKAPDAQSAPAAGPGATVSGRVLGPDGRPVPGAKLMVVEKETGGPAPQPVAGPDGRFAFRLPAHGMSHLIAAAPGFGADWVTLSAGESRIDVVLRLTEDLPITGRVIDLQGRPVAGAAVGVDDVHAGPTGAFDAMVKVWKKSADAQEQAARKLDRYIWNRGGLRQAFHTTTASDGTFTLAGFGKDRVVTLLITGAGIADTYAAVATRAGFDPAGAPRTPLRLYPPNFTLAVSPEKPVTGVVRDGQTGAPLAGIRVLGTSLTDNLPEGMYLFHAWPTPATTTDAAGHFTLHGLAKFRAYVLVADPAEGTEHLHRFAYVTDTEGFTPVSTNFSLPRGVVLTGRITDAATGAGVSCRVFYRPLETNEFMDGYGPPELPAPWHRGRDTHTDAQGRYAITVLQGAGVLHIQADNMGAYQTAQATKQEIDDGIVDKRFGHFRCAGQGGMYNPEIMNAYRVIRPARTDRTATLDVALQPKEPPAKEEGTAVKGRAFSPDRKPLAGAKLLLLGEGEACTELGTTGDDGRFAVAVPKDRKDTFLVVRADGVGIDFVELSELKPAAEVELRTVRDRPIRGRVVDTQGRPVAGARVAVNHVGVYPVNSLDPFLAEWKTRHFMSGLPGGVKGLWQPGGMKQQWRGAGAFFATTTDADGRFTIAGTGAERLVSLRLSRDGIADAEVWVANRDGFDPKPYNEATANKIPEGTDRSFGFNPLLYAPDLSLVAEAEKPVRGVVREADTGKPRAGVRVTMENYDGSRTYPLSATTDTAGRFEIRGARKAKSYTLEVLSDPTAGLLHRKVTVPDTGGYEPVTADVTVAKGVVITGRVLDKATGQGVPGFATVGILSDNPYPKARPELGSADWRFQSSAADGTFRVVTIPGPVLLMGGPDARRAPDGQSVRMRYKPPAADPKYPQYFKAFGDHTAFIVPGGGFSPLQGNFCKVLVIPPGTEVVTQDIVLEPANSLAVAIRDADGRPLTGVWATGMSPQNWTSPFRCELDTCTVYNLDPGKSRLLAFFDETKKLAGTLTLKGNEKPPVVAKLGPMASLRGRVVSDDGKPIAGVVIVVHYPERTAEEIFNFAHRDRQIVTYANGAFRIDDVIPGPGFQFYHYRQNKNPFRAQKVADRTWSVKPGETLDVGDLKAKLPDDAGE
jgi:RNA polymerase sigma factor (sigma-70 family)